MKRKSLITLLLSIAMTLVACGNPTTTSTDSASAEKGTSVADTGNSVVDAKDTASSDWVPEENTLPITDQGVELTIYCDFAGGARQVYNSMADMDIVKQMEKETGLKLSFVHPPENDDGTFFTTMIASGDYPDIIWNNFATYPGGPTAAMDDGVILDSTEEIKEKGYYFKQMLDQSDPEIKERDIWSDDGRIIRFGTTFIPEYLNNRVHGGFLVRKDLLDEAGITELPETFDEYDAMFAAFKKAGVVPWTTAMKDWQYIAYSPVASGLDLTYRNQNIKDGKVKFSRCEPEYKTFLTVMNDWYKKGYFTSDSLTQSISESQKQFQAGEAGAILCGSWEIVTLNSVLQANEPNASVIALPFPRPNKGDHVGTHGVVMQAVEDARMAYVSAKCEHPEEAVRFIDYLYKPETIMMTAWGVNTDDHTLWTEDENGKRSWTDFMTNNPDFDYEIGRQRYTANVLQGAWETNMEKLQYDNDYVQQAWKAWSEETDNTDLPSKFMTQTTDEAREISQLRTQIDTYGDENVFAFITGERSLDEFDSFVEELKGLGTDRLCELYQAAYDRYLARGK